MGKKTLLNDWMYTGKIMALALFAQAPDAESGVCRLAAERPAKKDTPGELSLFFPGCRSIAAPLLLFRFKRHGFSRCRAEAAPAGLTVHCFR